MRKRSYPWIAGACVALAILLLVLATQAGASPVPPSQGTPSAAGQAAPEGTVVLGPAEWAVWANIPGPTRNGVEDCVYSAPTQGGSAPETVQVGWGPLPPSGAGGRFPALPAEWLRQWWGQRPDEREALRGALEVGLRQLRPDGSQPVCRAVELEPAVCKPAKTAAALAQGFALTGDGKYVLFPVTGVDWDDPRVAFMLWGSYSPECGASTATPSPTVTTTPTSTPSPTTTTVPPTPSPTPTVVPPTPTSTPTATPPTPTVVPPTPVAPCWEVAPYWGWERVIRPHGWNAFAFYPGRYQISFWYDSLWQGIHKFWAASYPSQTAPYWQDLVWEWYSPAANRWEPMSLISNITGTGWASLPTGSVHLRITNLPAGNPGRCGYLWLDPEGTGSGTVHGTYWIFLPIVNR